MVSNSTLARITRGVIGAIFLITAFLCITRPIDSLISLTIIFGSIAIVKFVAEIILFFSIRRLTGVNSWELVLMGILNLVVGIVFLRNPVNGTVVLGYMFAFWFLADSIMSLSYSMNRTWENKSTSIISIVFCILGIVLAVIMFFNPGVAMFTIPLIAGYYFALFGIFEIMLAFSSQ